MGDEASSDDQKYGGCEGPDAMYVKLISSDGHEFIVKRQYALTSGTIKAMLSGPGQFAENETNEVNFREIPFLQIVFNFTSIASFIGRFKTRDSVENQRRSVIKYVFEIMSHVLQRVCIYFTYKVRYTNSSTEIPEFPIAPEIALELLMAANFLDC
ncbi:hypothetical protein HAZT_HAZT006964 [Hyalella azteca]|uniref:Elongin-C n=1 Tax=Hyalella azteca TaxID=294128 RepID=A0A6A0GR64_HYAAZ|nr:hypothetical protein HAZT_HAZT006964 [Hyalella azteca]